MGRKEKLVAVLNEIGFNLDTLENRKILQKKIYLLQYLGLTMDYGFSFYAYGPYSPSLTKDVFDFQSNLDTAPEVVKYEYEDLTDTDRSTIQELNKIIEQISSEDLSKMLELISSILFLSRLPYLEQDMERIETKLREMKPTFKFNQSEIDEAWRFLEELNLISS